MEAFKIKNTINLYFIYFDFLHYKWNENIWPLLYRDIGLES